VTGDVICHGEEDERMGTIAFLASGHTSCNFALKVPID
jgi:hypothetical protein